MKRIRGQWEVLFIAIVFFASAYPSARAATVATGVTIVIAPDAPSNFTATPDGPTQVTLSWTDNSNGLEDGFSVERKTGVGGTYTVIGTTASGVVTYTDNTASANTIYFYRVDAFTGGIFSSYSNEASVTTPNPSTPPSPPSNPGSGGGAGGGGGGSVPVTTNNNVTITGFAYPLSRVTLLQNGVQVLQTFAGPDGKFSASISDFPDGSYNFYVYATDSSGLRSTPFTFPVSVTTGATTDISGVFLSPTIGVDKQEVKKGDTVAIFGQTLPSAPVEIQVDSAVPIFVNTTSSATGAYVYDLNTDELALGSHIAKAEVQSDNLISDYSVAEAFTVGDVNITAAAPSSCPTKGDFNGDCKVNLVDFSMLSYWYGRSGAPGAYLLDNASTVDFADFSILAYYWTG